ncbi:altered inheritance of mitochondria protein 3-like [Salvia splendens]|uniref:altered inheritance of mitochondria protein 3-like n=1 Tax=Salvia splendens TaxID=180675 RepID=UPI001C27ABCE|nr:altered inheritance of mitochondria protein 3-like [Salvia splendens]
MAFCNILNKRLDKLDEQQHAHHQYDLPQPVQPFHPYPQPPLPYTLPQANPNSCWDPPWAHLPTAPLQYSAPWQTMVEPYFDNQPQPYFHDTNPYMQLTSQTYIDPWQQEQLVYRPPPPPQHYFNTQPPPSHDYHQPPQLSSQQLLLTAALPHQNYPQVPPPKIYQPPPPPPLIPDCDRVEEGFADSTKKIPDSSVGFGGVEKVEKMEKSSPDSARKEKPVQGCIEIQCSRQLNASRIKILKAHIGLGSSIVDNASLKLLSDSSHVRDVASMNHRSTSLDANA